MEQSNRKNIIFFFTAAFLVYINFLSSLTILPLYTLELGGNEFHSGLQNTIFFIAAVLMRLYFGPMADSSGRKAPLFIGTFAFTTAPLLFMVSSSYWILVLTRIYQAIGLAAFFSSAGSLLADLAPRDKVGTYVGAYRLVINISLLVGPAAALFLIKMGNYYHIWFIINFCIGVLAFLLIVPVKPPLLPSGDNIGSWERTKAVLLNKKMWPIIYGFVLIYSSYGALLTYALIYITRVVKVDNPELYFTCFSIAGIAAYLSAGYLSDRFGRKIVAWPSVMLKGLGVAVLYFLPVNPIIIILSSSIAGFGFAGGISALMAWVVDVTEKRHRATAMAVQESTIDLSIATGTLFFGIISGFIGLSLSFALMGVVLLAGPLVISAVAKREIRA